MSKKELEKRCELCNKPYSYKYKLFGRTCVTNLYEQLKIKIPKYISNKESFLSNIVALKEHKWFLSRNKKFALLENYIAIDYINKMNLSSLLNIKKSLEKNIKEISLFNKKYQTLIPYVTLNDFYKLNNDTKKFN